ncbi:winged helix-turn-helix domain-containing protein [Actinocatenispora rupis]|uniref:GntR family transcriptional regulator n=1 Tax=Actinocatenispora rupis TaxID=519421 RepID=UPI0031EDA26C
MTESETLVDLDPDDPRPPAQQIANMLRAAIRTGKLSPGDKLPSQHDLAARYGVARETVKRALAALHAENLTVSRQGSGVFVRQRTEKAVGLRPHIEAAFERSHVSIDFAGFSGETLNGALQEPLDKVRAGRLRPESIVVRLLLTDLSRPTMLPSNAETGQDDPAVRSRADRIIRRSVESIVEAVQELGAMGLVRSARAEVRTHDMPPSFKMYILNGDEVFFAFYPVVDNTVTVDGTPTVIRDVLGKDTPLFHYANSDGDTSVSVEFIEQAQRWFDTRWDMIAKEYPV